jgi:hypothetical protein
MLLTTTGTAWDAISLTRPSIYLSLRTKQEVPFEIFSDLGIVSYPSAQIPLTIGVGMLQIALVWLLAWLWMRWQEKR